jgi:hypothetical protein
VSSRLGERLSQLVSNHSVAGDGLLERARSVAFALLGLTAAIGLGLVLFISHLSWPNIPDISIPGLPVEHGAHNHAVAVTPAFKARNAVLRHRSPSTASARSGAGGGVATSLHADGSNHPRLSGSEQVLVPAPSPSSGGEHPVGEGPAGVPSTPPPAAPTPPPAPPSPSPAPVASSPPAAVTVDHPSKGHGRGLGSSKGGGSVPNAGEHSHVPHAPVVTVEPPGQYPVEPGKDEPSPPQGDMGPGNGHGHGYGHYGR